jgi:glycerate-2-kinase
MRKTQRIPLCRIASEALARVHPGFLLRAGLPAFAGPRAVLLWGKAAEASLQALSSREPELGRGIPVLVLSPEPRRNARDLGPQARFLVGEHPIPGEGSLRAGAGLLEFFARLRDLGTLRLDVYLSGGASSAAWLPTPAHASAEGWAELRARLEALYRRPFSIAELNAARARLCALKAGGAARALGLLAPRVRAHAHILSDVLPFAPSWVGSGPFAAPGVRVHVIADARAWLAEMRRLAGAESTLLAEVWSRPVEAWADDLARAVRAELRAGRRGLLITVGEPQVRVPAQAKGRGGRLTHLACALATRLRSELASGRVELHGASSDGVDGRSGASAVSVDRARLPQARDLARALAAYATAEPLAAAGCLATARASGTNVQDALLVRL